MPVFLSIQLNAPKAVPKLQEFSNTNPRQAASNYQNPTVVYQSFSHSQFVSCEFSEAHLRRPMEPEILLRQHAAILVIYLLCKIIVLNNLNIYICDMLWKIIL
jgi:hypothetical protein